MFLSKGFAAIDFRNLVRQHIYDANIKGIGPGLKLMIAIRYYCWFNLTSDGQELKMTLKLLRNRRVVVKPLSEAQLDEQLAKELEWLKLSNSIPTIDQCQMQPRDVEKYFEEEKSRVVIRRCHRCKQHLAKEGGCNELICVCGAKICYICRFPSPDFQHWCQ